MSESTDPQSLLLRIDDVCDHFENEWKSGRAPALRAVIDGIEASPEELPRFFHELLLLELELRSEAGESVDGVTYTEKFPEFHEVVRRSLRQFRAKSRRSSATAEQAADFETCLRYKLIEPLAEGGLGRIYRVLDTTLDRELAMKEIKRGVDNANTRARFDREARLTGKLDHPGITPVFGIGSHPDGRPLYVMRLIRGESLRDVIRKYHGDDEGTGGMTLELRTLLAKFVSVCDVIAYSHSQNIVHRDLKPSNVMLGPFGEVLVVDWGLAKEVSAQNIGTGETSTSLDGTATQSLVARTDSFQTIPGRAVGTPQFMSPEQALAKIDEIGPLSDIYSLGATLYDLLTGRPPFSESNQSETVLRRVVLGDFLGPRKVRPGLPRSLEAVCLKAMALSPANRYQNAAALAEDLRRWLADEPVTARPEPFLEKTRRWLARNRVAASAFAGALVIALCVGIPVEVRSRIAEQEKLTRAKSVAGLILSSNDESLAGLINGLNRGDAVILKELASRFGDPRLDDDGKLKAALALGPGKVEIRDYLERSLLDAPLAFLPLISQELKDKHSPTLMDRLFSSAGDETESKSRRFHAAVALARFNVSNSPRARAFWRANATMVIASLIESIGADPSLFGKLVKSFEPVQHELFPALASEYREHPRPGVDGPQSGQRTIASAIIDDFQQTPEELVELLKDTQVGPRLVKYLERVKALGPPVFEALKAELERPFTSLDPRNPDTAADSRSTRKARLAVALFSVGERDSVWSYFGTKERPGVREEFLRRLPEVSPEVRAAILERLPKEKDEAILRGLIESLASFPTEEPAKGIPGPTQDWLLQQYRLDPDPGVHGAIEWLIRDVLKRPAEIADLDKSLHRANPMPGFDWFIELSGQTLSIIHPNNPVTIGSPESEPERGAAESIHDVQIGRIFAIATREVSLESFRRYVAETPRTSRPIPVIEVPLVLRNDQAPVVAVSWRDAAGYCNWLSRLNGLPKTEWCYADVDLDQDEVRLVPDLLEKTGYRLPTEAEWETACRAGTRSSRPFGDGWNRAEDFGWFPQNAGGRLRTTGMKRPNGYGLFDMLGNASEWTLSPFASDSKSSGIEPQPDSFDINSSDLTRSRVIRGGSLLIPARPRSALRDASLPTNQMTDLGFRVCRTLP